MTQTAPIRKRPWARTLAYLGGAAAAVAAWLVYPGLWAEAHLSAALRAERAEDYELARSHLALSLRAKPGAAEYHFHTARVCRRDGDLRAAAHHLETAAGLGHDPEALRVAELLLTTLRAGWRETDGALQELLRSGHPAKAEVHEVLARAYFNDYLFHRSFEQCKAWQAADPESAAAWELKGEIENRMGQTAGASESYLNALARNPNLYRAHVGYAGIVARQQEYGAAAEHFRRARDLRPTAREPRVGLAQVLMEEYRLDDARRELEAVRAFAPDDREVIGLAGRVEFRAGRLLEAEQLLRRSAERGSDRAVLHDLQQCLVRLGKVAEAKAVGARLEQLHRDLNRMEVLAQFMMRTTDPASRFEAGQIMIRNGFVREGIAWFEQALRFDPTYAPARQALAAARGQPAGAAGPDR